MRTCSEASHGARRSTPRREGRGSVDTPGLRTLGLITEEVVGSDGSASYPLALFQTNIADRPLVPIVTHGILTITIAARRQIARRMTLQR